MRLLITSGGTREPIDSVRYVGNTASGRTGNLIAEEAVRRFHTAFLLSGRGSVPIQPWAASTGLVVQTTFGSTQDLLEACSKCLLTPVEAIVASAAVADYTPEPFAGKLSSAEDELVVRMKPTVKVIDRLREMSPKAVLVAFKLESGLDREELFARALSTLRRSGADLVVANDTVGMGEPAHPAHFLDRHGLICSVTTRFELAGRLIELLEERVCS